MIQFSLIIQFYGKKIFKQLFFFGFLSGMGFWAATGLGQESQWQSLAGEASAMGRKSSPEQMDYNLEVGPVLLNVGAGLSGGYNSNTGLSQEASGGSAYATPSANLSLLWPITDLNTLTFALGFGYSYYFEVANDNSPGGFFISPNSALTGTFFVGDFRFTPYDQFSLQNDPTAAGELSNISRFSIYQNSAGCNVDWDLADLIVTLGFDWFNIFTGSGSTDLSYLERRTLTPSLAITYYITKTLIAGAQATAALTDYTGGTGSYAVPSTDPSGSSGASSGPTVSGQNNNIIYSFGPFANWTISEYMTLTGRAGYTLGEFQDTNASSAQAGGNPSTYFFNLGFSHRLNEYLDYTLGASRSTQLSAIVGTNFVETWVFSLGLNWKIIDELSLTTPLSANLGQVSGDLYPENYQQYTGGIGLGYKLTERLGSSLNFTYIIKNSDLPNTSYQQWNATLGFSYDF